MPVIVQVFGHLLLDRLLPSATRSLAGDLFLPRRQKRPVRLSVATETVTDDMWRVLPGLVGQMGS
jgi:hypothetical protein